MISRFMSQDCFVFFFSSPVLFVYYSLNVFISWNANPKGICWRLSICSFFFSYLHLHISVSLFHCMENSRKDQVIHYFLNHFHMVNTISRLGEFARYGKYCIDFIALHRDEGNDIQIFSPYLLCIEKLKEIF